MIPEQFTRTHGHTKVDQNGLKSAACTYAPVYAIFSPKLTSNGYIMLIFGRGWLLTIKNPLQHSKSVTQTLYPHIWSYKGRSERSQIGFTLICTCVRYFLSETDFQRLYYVDFLPGLTFNYQQPFAALQISHPDTFHAYIPLLNGSSFGNRSKNREICQKNRKKTKSKWKKNLKTSFWTCKRHNLAPKKIFVIVNRGQITRKKGPNYVFDPFADFFFDHTCRLIPTPRLHGPPPKPTFSCPYEPKDPSPTF